jgi:hypothetical protein
MLVPNIPKSQLSSAFITKELFWTPWSHFTDFRGHTTIFKGTVIPKIYMWVAVGGGKYATVVVHDIDLQYSYDNILFYG